MWKARVLQSRATQNWTNDRWRSREGTGSFIGKYSDCLSGKDRCFASGSLKPDVFRKKVSSLFAPALPVRAAAGSLRCFAREDGGWLAGRSPKGERWWSRGDLNP